MVQSQGVLGLGSDENDLVAGDGVQPLLAAGRGVFPKRRQADRQGAGQPLHSQPQAKGSALRVDSTHNEVLDPARLSFFCRAPRVSGVDEAA